MKGYTKIMKVGIFDSGLGAKLVTNNLRRILPQLEYQIATDQAHAPYGERSPEEVARLTEAAIKPLLSDCSIIILACNTATAAAIEKLRSKYPSKIFIGFEPMVKPAAAISTNKHISMLATRATSSSYRTQQLIERYGRELVIDTPDTTSWASKIDAGSSESINFDQLERSIKAGSDTIIIGCTHYIKLMPKLEKLFPTVRLLEPSEAVAQRLAKLLNAEPPR